MIGIKEQLARLTRKVAGMFQTETTTFTPTNGSSYASFGGCWYRRYGNVIEVHIGIRELTTNTWTQVYTMPAGYIPTTTIHAVGQGTNSGTIAEAYVGTDGGVSVYTTNGTYATVDIKYIVSGSVMVDPPPVFADYVVETGSSGNYTWTKWNSGKMELEYINSGVSITNYSTVITGAMYGYYHDLSFPVTFVGSYIPTHTWQIGSGWGFSAGMLQGTSTDCRLFAMGSTQGTQTCSIWAHIVGRWK